MDVTFGEESKADAGEVSLKGNAQQMGQCSYFSIQNFADNQTEEAWSRRSFRVFSIYRLALPFILHDLCDNWNQVCLRLQRTEFASQQQKYRFLNSGALLCTCLGST